MFYHLIFLKKDLFLLKVLGILEVKATVFMKIRW